MPVATATLTIDIGALPADTELIPSYLEYVAVETTVPAGEPLIDTTTGGEIKLGGWRPTVDNAGVATVVLPRTNTGNTNPPVFQYRCRVKFWDPASGRHETWVTTPFDLTADAALSTLMGQAYAPPQWHPVNHAQLEAAVDDAVAAAIAVIDGGLL